MIDIMDLLSPVILESFASVAVSDAVSLLYSAHVVLELCCLSYQITMCKWMEGAARLRNSPIFKPLQSHCRCEGKA